VRWFGTLLLAATATAVLWFAWITIRPFVLDAATVAVAAAFTMRAARNMSAAVYQDLAGKSSRQIPKLASNPTVSST
jgi:hypothetical protein